MADSLHNSLINHATNGSLHDLHSPGYSVANVAAMSAISTGSAGDLAYVQSSGSYYAYTGSVWLPLNIGINRSGTTTDGHLAVWNGSNAESIKDGGTVPNGLLAIMNYAPGPTTIYSTTSATLADVDATNMKVVFTAPASGNVIVRLSAYCDIATGGTGAWGLREATTDIASGYNLNQAELSTYVSMPFYLTGISAGSHTYKWSFARTTSGTFRIVVNGAGGGFPAAVMEVWSCP